MLNPRQKQKPPSKYWKQKIYRIKGEIDTSHTDIPRGFTKCLSLSMIKQADCLFLIHILHIFYFLTGSDGKACANNAGDPGSFPGSGRFSGEGNGNPLQYSCLENPLNRGAWWATVHGVTKSRTRLSNYTSLHFFISSMDKQLFLLSNWTNN